MGKAKKLSETIFKCFQKPKKRRERGLRVESVCACVCVDFG